LTQIYTVFVGHTGLCYLGALVSRFAVLFTAGGPAGKFADEKNKATEATEKNGFPPARE